MVSPVDGPGPPPGSYLPVPTGGRSVVPYTRTQSDDPQPVSGGAGDRRRSAAPDAAVATPLGPERADPRQSRTNPFADRGEPFGRPFLGARPASAFLAQALGQAQAALLAPAEADGAGDSVGSGRRDAAEAARRYQNAQDVVDRAADRRRGPPGTDIVA